MLAQTEDKELNKKKHKPGKKKPHVTDGLQLKGFFLHKGHIFLVPDVPVGRRFGREAERSNIFIVEEEDDDRGGPVTYMHL